MAEPKRFRPVHQRNKPVTKRGIDDRLSSAKRGYDRRWRKYRKTYLLMNPWCVECLKPTINPVTGEQEPGRHVLATQVDHIVEAVNGIMDERFYDSTNHQGLCHTHHSQKTFRHHHKTR